MHQNLVTYNLSQRQESWKSKKVTFKKVLTFLMMVQGSLHSRINDKMQDTHPEYYYWDGMPFIMKKFRGF